MRNCGSSARVVPHPKASPRAASGLPLALGAYFIWGLLPLYLRLVKQVPAFEFIAWRIIWTVPLCLLFVTAARQWSELIAALRDSASVVRMALSAALIAVNWCVYVLAIQQGHVLAASLGYYINPLVNVLAGTLFLGERLSKRQWWAVALAAIGVSLLAWGAREMLYISLTLATTFAAYGLVRKLAPVGALPGLTIESSILALPAMAVAAWYAASPAGSSMGQGLISDGLIAFSGVVTAVPLLMFAVAARRMDYSLLGMCQFVAPTMVFLTGLAVFGEPLRPIQLACFVLIWLAIGVFVWDLLAQRSAQKTPA